MIIIHARKSPRANAMRRKVARRAHESKIDLLHPYLRVFRQGSILATWQQQVHSARFNFRHGFVGSAFCAVVVVYHAAAKQ